MSHVKSSNLKRFLIAQCVRVVCDINQNTFESRGFAASAVYTLIDPGPVSPGANLCSVPVCIKASTC